MRSASLLVAAVVAVLILHFGRAAIGGHVVADRSYGEDVYHLALLYERWADHVGSGHLPTWMPEFGGGYPAPAAWMYGLLYPGLLLFAVLPSELAWTWTGILHAAFGALGMVHLVRAGGAVEGRNGQQRPGYEGAVTAGLLFAFSEFVLGRMVSGHVNLVMPLAWAPWVLWQAIRTVRGDRYAVPALALCAALGLLAGHVQLWFYLAPLAGAVAVVEWWPARPANAPRRLAIAVCAALALSAPQWLAAAGLLAQSGSGGVDPVLRNAGAVPIDHLVAAGVPGVLGAAYHTYWAQEVLEHEFRWIGGVWTLLLVLLALRRRDALTRTWAVAAVLGLLVAVRAPWTGWLHDLPPLTAARAPSRALVVPLLATCVLAGMGLDRWMADLPAERTERWRRLAAPAGLAVAAAVAGPLWAFYGRVGAAPSINTFAGDVTRGALINDIVLPALAATIIGLAAVVLALVHASRAGPLRWAPVAVVGAVAWLVGAPSVETVPSAFMHTDWSETIPPALRAGRLHLDGNRFPEVERNGGRTMRELCHVDSEAFQRLWREPGPAAAFWFDVTGKVHREWRGSVFEPPPDTAPSALLRVDPVAPIGPGALFERSGTAVMLTTDAVVERVLAGDPDLHVETDAGTSRHPRAAGGSVRRVDDPDPCRAVFEVDAARPAWLFVAEKFHDGWSAEVDGAATVIRRANGVFRALEVPAGLHRVTFTYRPVAYSVGGWLTLAGLLAVGGLVALDRAQASSGRAT